MFRSSQNVQIRQKPEVENFHNSTTGVKSNGAQFIQIFKRLFLKNVQTKIYLNILKQQVIYMYNILSIMCTYMYI